MKIAVCISGHLRNYEETAERLLENFAEFESDIFICTWNYDNINGRPVQEENVVKNYSPKSFKIELYEELHFLHYEKYQKIKPYKKFDATWHKNREGDASYNQFYLIRKCNDIKRKYEREHKIKYDVVFRIRPDIQIQNFRPQTIENNSIYFPYNCFHQNMTDAAFYGSSEAMDQATMCYDLVDFYLFNHRIKWINEFIFDFHLKFMNLNKITDGFIFRFSDHADMLSKNIENDFLDPETAARLFSRHDSYFIFEKLRNQEITKETAIKELEKLELKTKKQFI